MTSPALLALAGDPVATLSSGGAERTGETFLVEHFAAGAPARAALLDRFEEALEALDGGFLERSRTPRQRRRLRGPRQLLHAPPAGGRHAAFPASAR